MNVFEFRNLLASEDRKENEKGSRDLESNLLKQELMELKITLLKKVLAKIRLPLLDNNF